jgi:hypothetical protein
MAESFDAGTRERVGKLPLLSINAGPRDKEGWEARLKEVGTWAAAALGWQWLRDQQGRQQHAELDSAAVTLPHCTLPSTGADSAYPLHTTE